MHKKIKKAVYDGLIVLVHKSQGDEIKRFQAYLERAMDDAEGLTAEQVQKVLAQIKTRFLQGFSVEQFLDASDAERKSIIKQAVTSAFDFDVAQKIVGVLSNVVDQTLNYYKTEFKVKVDYDLINQGAVDALRSRQENTFSTLSDNMARQIRGAIADAQSEKHTIKDVVANIRETFGDNVPVYDANGNLIREIPNDQWATIVARTEGARAASQAQISLLSSLGLQKMEYAAEDSACDECGPFDGQLFDVDDEDHTPPLHANCRCIVMAVMEELTSATEDASGDEEADSNN